MKEDLRAWGTVLLAICGYGVGWLTLLAVDTVLLVALFIAFVALLG